MLVLAAGCGGAGHPKPSAGAMQDDAGETSGPAVRPAASPEVARAEQALAAGNAAEAKKALLAETQAHPDDARAFYDLGMAHEALGDTPSAMRSYAKASELSPTFPEPLNNLAVILRAGGKVNEALPLLERAVRADSNFVAADVNLALTRTDLGDLEGARSAYARAVELEPGDALVRANYGQVLFALGDGEGARSEWRRALSDLENADPSPGTVAALQTVGSGLRRVDDADNAVHAMELAIDARKDGPTPALLAEYSLAQRAAGDREGAEKSLRKAIALDDKYAVAHYLLGNTLAGDGKFTEALKHFQRYLELSPDGDQAASAKERIAICEAQAGKNPAPQAEEPAPPTMKKRAAKKKRRH